MPEHRKILQIIPAEGWWAGFNGTSEDGLRHGSTGFTRLVCWALVENDDDETEVLGMDGEGDTHVLFADRDFAFDGYWYHPNRDPNEADKEALGGKVDSV